MSQTHETHELSKQVGWAVFVGLCLGMIGGAVWALASAPRCF